MTKVMNSSCWSSDDFSHEPKSEEDYTEPFYQPFFVSLINRKVTASQNNLINRRGNSTFTSLINKFINVSFVGSSSSALSTNVS